MSGSSCREQTNFLGPYLDGELEAGQLLDIESHVAACGVCHERVELDWATRASLKRTVRSAASPAFRARALGAMGAAHARVEARHVEVNQGNGWRTMLPLATAAALALVFGAAGRGDKSALARDGEAVQAGFGGGLLAELISEHSRPLPPERTDPKEVRALEQYVGVPVHPGTFEKTGAHLVGGRILPVAQERAALLQYTIGTGAGQQRVSVFIYDPSKIQVQSASLAPRAVGTAEVQAGRANGYSVAVTERGGVGYAFASDLDADRNAQLAALASDE